MKRSKSLIVVAFLLMLYISPMIFISSYVGVAIPAEPNMSKDFSPSAYGDESNQSIPSFDETLPDDVLFYPDSEDRTVVYHYVDDYEEAYGASPDSSLTVQYNSYTTVNTATTTDYDPSSPIAPSDSFVMAWAFVAAASFGLSANVEFNYSVPIGDKTFDACYSGSLSDSSMASNNGTLGGVWTIAFWNQETDLWDTQDTISAGWTWGREVSLSISNEYISGNQILTVRFRIYRSDTGYAGLWLYNAFVNMNTLADSNHYAESFYDVNNWTLEAGPANPTSDGDVGIQYVEGDWSYDSIATNSISLDVGSYYVEIRYKRNTTAGACEFRPVFYTENDLGGTIDNSMGTLNPTTTWQTTKGILNGTGIESILFYTRAGANIEIQLDYFRVSPANESGWQYDGSTIIEGTDTDGILSSDGYNLNFTADDNADHLFIYVDNTPTRAFLDTDDYPFFMFSVSSATGNYRVDVRDKAAGSYTVHPYSDSIGVFRYNMLAVVDSFSYVRVFLESAGTSVIIQYIKAYSIANYTITQSGVSVDDYLYCEDGVLYSHIDSGTIIANHDPTLNLSLYRGWNMNTDLGTPEIDFYDGAWLGYSSATSGEFSIFTTVTDFRLKFTANANIISLTFFDAVRWQDTGTAVIIFWTAVFEGSLDALLIFLGLIMIPASTLYFVKGGKDEMSSNKVYYCLIAFVIGWALFLGGIYG